MSLEQRFTDFTEKHSLEDSAIADLLHIWNETFIEIAHGLLKDTIDNSNNKKTEKKTEKKPSKAIAGDVSEQKKWASKIASEYAAEKGLTLDDFETGKITKKHVNDLIKTRTVPEIGHQSGEKTVKVTKTKKTEKCHGLTKKGDVCNRTGTHEPEGSKFVYCFRHANDWQDFECSSDSSGGEDSDDDLSVEPIARPKTADPVEKKKPDSEKADSDSDSDSPLDEEECTVIE